MSAHTVSDGGGAYSPSLVADNPKKPPDKGATRVNPVGVGEAPGEQRTPTGTVRALWTSAKRGMNALASPTKRGGSSAKGIVRVTPDEEDESDELEQSTPTKMPGNKRRKKNRDDVWTGAPLVPDVHMEEVETGLLPGALGDDDVFTTRPHITPMLGADLTEAVTEAAEDMDAESDDASQKFIGSTLAGDIASIRERLTQDAFASEWVRKELALLVEHARQLRRDAPEGARYGFDFDTTPTAPELMSAAPPAQDSAIDNRLAKLEANFAKLFDALTGGKKLDVTPTLVQDATTASAAPTAPLDPNSYAARASAAPSSAPSATQAASNASGRQTKGTKNAHPRRYEETRAIFQLAAPLRHSERTEKAKRIAADVELVNDALLEHCGASMGPRVAGLSWSENGNLVLMAMEGWKGEHLVEHSEIIVAAMGLTCEVKARTDVPWHKVTLTRVPTSGPDGHLLSDDDVRVNLRKTNPRFAILNLVDSMSPVHWLTSEQARRSQTTASMIVCLSSQEDADALLQLNNRLYVHGHTCGTHRFEERNADPMCTNCWTVKPKHRTATCKGEPRCKFCAGTHHSDEHTCKSCEEERATSNGDEQMENGNAPAHVGACAHIPLKCVNCGEPHAANDARCPYRRKMVGSNAGAPPLSGVAQAKRPPRRNRRSPATGANATEPAQKETEIGWADPEVWPMTLPYGDAEDGVTGGATKDAAKTAPTAQSGTHDVPETATDAPAKVVTLPSASSGPSTPLSGPAKRQARIKLLKEAFPSASEKEWRSWTGAANGDVEVAIKLGTAHYEGSAKTAPGDRKMDTLRAQWAAMDENQKKTPYANGPDASASASKMSINNLLHSKNANESA